MKGSRKCPCRPGKVYTYNLSDLKGKNYNLQRILKISPTWIYMPVSFLPFAKDSLLKSAQMHLMPIICSVTIKC